MAIELHCKCGHLFSVPEDARGTLVACPACEGRIFVPSGPDGRDEVEVARPAQGPDATRKALTSEEMLALREEAARDGEERAGAAGVGETQASEGRRAAAARETEVSPPGEAGGPSAPLPEAQVVAGPEDSGVRPEPGGFAVRYEEAAPAERRRYERCPQCDAELEADARVCTNCGFDLLTGERIRRVTVEGPDLASAEVAAQVGLGVAALLTKWVVKLRHALIGAAGLAFVIILLANFGARRAARDAYLTEVSGGGAVGRLWEEAQKAVEQEAFDLERRTQEQVQMAMVKLRNEPDAEEGVFSEESRAAAREAYLRAREAEVIHRDRAGAERLLAAMDVLYGTMDPWGRRARDELARLRGAASQPAASAPASGRAGGGPPPLGP